MYGIRGRSRAACLPIFTRSLIAGPKHATNVYDGRRSKKKKKKTILLLLLLQYERIMFTFMAMTLIKRQ